MMSDFQSLYIKLCSQFGVEKQACVLNAIQPNGFLDLSEQTLSSRTAKILGKIFEVSKEIVKINLSNCIVDEEGEKALILGLRNNSSVIHLNLKGIITQGKNCFNFADVLKHNSTLKSISLEWVNVGLDLGTFNEICKAFESNTSVEFVDLKSNQLNSEAAKLLSRAILKNSTLRHLDLRFNNLGNCGGKTLLEAIRLNSSLKQLQLAGNNISNDILNEMASHLIHNIKLDAVKEEYQEENSILRQRLLLQDEKSSKQIEQLETSLSNTNSSLASVIRESQSKVEQVQMNLRKSREEFETLQLKYDIMSKKSLEDKNSLHVLLKEKTSLEKEQMKYHETDKRLRKELQEMKNSCLKYESTKAEVFNLKEKIIALETELRAFKMDSERELENEKKKYKETLRKQEKDFISHVSKLRKELEEKDIELKKDKRLCESIKEELESEIKELKSKLTSTKENHIAQIAELKRQIKADHINELRILQNQLQETKQNREEIEAKLRMQISTCSTLTSCNTRLESQIHTLNNQISTLQAEVEGKNSSIRIAEQRIRQEMQCQLDELQSIKERKIKLEEAIEQMKRKCENEKSELNDTILKREEEIKRLKNELLEKKKEILCVKEDESKRISILHSAFVNYLHPSKTEL